MDPILKLWMFYSWIEDKSNDVEIVKNHAYLLGSFSNPEAVKRAMSEGNKIVSSEEAFEESSNIVKNQSFNINDLVSNNTNEPIQKRRRRTLKG